MPRVKKEVIEEVVMPKLSNEGVEIKCPTCNGTGRNLPEQTCPTCEGTGK